MIKPLAQLARRRGARISILAIPLLAGCVYPGVEMTAIPARIDYVCAKDKILPVARREALPLAGVLVDGQQIGPPRADSAAQERHSNRCY